MRLYKITALGMFALCSLLSVFIDFIEQGTALS